MARRKHALPFDRRGGVVAIQRRVIDSENYLLLSAQAKVLMTLMHCHWRNDKPIDFGIREAATKIPCDRKTAIRAFQELRQAGFIVLVDESYFSSRTQSKSRTWRLTWLPYFDKPPTNEWEKAE